MELKELSLRSRIGYSQFQSFLSLSLKIPLEQITVQDQFWEKIGTDEEILVGLRILYSDKGYLTFAYWAQLMEMSKIEFLTLACEAAEYFGTEVAIGDFFEQHDESTGLYLVATPGGFVERAVEISNGEVFEVEAYETPKLLSQLLRELK